MSEKKTKSVTVVIPAYNEEGRVGGVIKDYERAFESLGWVYEILVVCNGCVDGTKEIVESIAKGNPRIRVLLFKERLGKGRAIIKGFKAARGDLIGFVDADESTSAAEYLKLVSTLEDPTVDGAIASRKADGSKIAVYQSLSRRLAGRVFNLIVRGLFGLSFRDTQCGAKVFKKRAVRDVIDELKLNGYEFDVELLWRLKKKGYLVEEVPVEWRHGEGSKFSLIDGPGMLLRLLELRIKDAYTPKLLRYALPLVLFFGLALRVYSQLMVPVTNPDGLLYSWLAINLAEGSGYNIAEGESLNEIRSWRVPVFPLTLAFFYKIIGNGFLVSKLPSLIFGMGTIIMTYLLAEKLFSKKAALISALFVGVTPFLALSSAEIMTESMYTFFLITSLYFMLSLNTGKRRPILVGTFIGLAYLTRTIGMTLLPVGAAYYLYSGERGRIPLLFLGFALLAVPWWAWSYSEYGSALAAERYSSEYQFYLEFDYYPKGNLNMLDYFFSYHSLAEFFRGIVDGGLKLGVYLALSLAFIGIFPVIIGIMKEKDRSVNLLLLGTLLAGLLATSWQAHLSMYPRYVVPYLPILTIYLGKGLLYLYRSGRVARGFAHLFVVAAVIFGVAIPAIHISEINEAVELEYRDITSGISKDTHVVASNPTLAKKIGFDKVHPLGDMDFDKILTSAENKKIVYILVDSSAIHNNNQFYLVTHWYKSRIPREIQYVAGGSYHSTLYRIRE